MLPNVQIEKKRWQTLPVIFQRTIQTLFLLYALYIGWKFYHFLQWVTGTVELYTPRPASVEAFLPISALLGLRTLIQNHSWDTIHPAALSFLLIVILTAFLFRKLFCGYICPFGLLSGWLNTAGEKIGLGKEPPRWLGLLMQSLKYLILAFFLYTIFIQMSLLEVKSFMRSPFNLIAEARMFTFFSSPSVLTVTVCAVLLLLGVILRSFWCRYLCPYGALLGIFSRFSPVFVYREPDKCVNCGECSSACPMGIEVEECDSIHSFECTGCLSCRAACPVTDCITVRLGKATKDVRESLPWWSLGVGGTLCFLLLWFIAKIFGYWDSVPPEMLQIFYQNAL